jgi:hypothetical protein
MSSARYVLIASEMTAPRSDRFPFLAPLDDRRDDLLALWSFPLLALRTKLDELAADYPEKVAVELFWVGDTEAPGASPFLAPLGGADRRSLAVRSVIGGPGPMLGSRHPWSAGRPLGHLMTLVSDRFPSLRAVFPDAAAVSLFCNEVPEGPRNRRYVSVLPIDAMTLAGGFTGLGGVRPRHILDGLSIEVPAALFQATRRRKDPRLARLHTRLGMVPGRAGGGPIWVQPETNTGKFLFQLDGALGGIGGDAAAATMYAFEDDFYLQIH